MCACLTLGAIAETIAEDDAGAAVENTAEENTVESVSNVSDAASFADTIMSDDDPFDSPSDAPASSGAAATPLTLADFGIQMHVPISAIDEGLNSYTFVVSTDNENNTHSDSPDYDFNNYLDAGYSVAPVEVRFDLDVLPTRNAYIAIHAYDYDETNGNRPEYDAVYVNNTKVGVMTGQDDEWNTTWISISVSTLRLGANTGRQLCKDSHRLARSGQGGCL